MKKSLEDSLSSTRQEFESVREKLVHIQDRLDSTILENSKLQYNLGQVKTLLEQSERDRSELYQKMMNLEGSASLCLTLIL